MYKIFFFFSHHSELDETIWRLFSIFSKFPIPTSHSVRSSMDAPLHSLQTLESSVCGPTEESSDADLVDTISVDSIISHANPTVQFPPLTSASTTTASKLINMKKKKKKKKRALVDVSAPSPSSSSSSNSMYVRVGNKRRNPRILMGLNRRSESEAEAIALPLGMSIAAIVSQVWGIFIFFFGFDSYGILIFFWESFDFDY